MGPERAPNNPKMNFEQGEAPAGQALNMRRCQSSLNMFDVKS